MKRILLLLAIGIGLMGCTNAFTTGSLTLNKERGDTIVAALDAYHAENAAYPATLSMLAPEFLPNIPFQYARQRVLLQSFTKNPICCVLTYP